MNKKKEETPNKITANEEGSLWENYAKHLGQDLDNISSVRGYGEMPDTPPQWAGSAAKSGSFSVHTSTAATTPTTNVNQSSIALRKDLVLKLIDKACFNGVTGQSIAAYAADLERFILNGSDTQDRFSPRENWISNNK